MKKNKDAATDYLPKSSFSTEDLAVSASLIQQELETYIDPVKREYLPNFFKTGKGQYGGVAAKSMARVSPVCLADVGGALQEKRRKGDATA